MKQTKFILIAAGVIGIIALFLPYVSVGPISMKLWDMRKMEAPDTVGLLNGPKQVYIALVAFLGIAAMGGIAMAAKKLLRWQGIVAILFGLVALACEMVRKGFSGDHGVSTAIGGKLIFLAPILAIIGGALAIAKPEQN